MWRQRRAAARPAIRSLVEADRRRRRFNPLAWRRVAFWAVLALFLYWRCRSDDAPPARPVSEGAYAVERVVDGDTLILAGGVTVRLIGVDCPETVHPSKPEEPWGREATTFTRRLTEGRQVRLQFDRERLDRYERYLAYVWLGDTLVNEELLRAGLGRAEPQYRYSSAMKNRFRRAQQEAQSARRGLWSRSPAPNL